MPGQKWYLLCVAFGVAAVAAECVADQQAGAAAMAATRATAVDRADDVQSVVQRHLELCGVAGITGLVLAGLSVVNWAISLRRGEGGWESIPVLLIITYVLLFFLTV